MTAIAQPAATTEAHTESTTALVKKHVTAVVSRLQGGYLSRPRSTSESVRALALLRRSLGAAGSTDPRMWALVLADMPERLVGPTSRSITEPTAAEKAVLAALTTYAVHQQAQQMPMHVVGVGLGEATRRLAAGGGDDPGGLDDAVVQRMHRVAMAQNDNLRQQSLRALITLMRSATPPVPLDYGRLAADLYLLQDLRYAPQVHLVWGRQLHTRPSSTANPEAHQSPDQHTPGESQ
ncbi:MAG TPA: type I-E CRISPR-associated protein Cse2/CasB [Intrasporangiaceae bacterium]|nr:type I-E CRISPR-associated protein Cse2/CasB [Intrasporangiaceae bacterium]